MIARRPLIGVAVGLTLAALLIPATDESLQRLSQLHAARLADTAGVRARAPDSAHLRVQTGSAAKAQAMLAGRVRRAAGANGVLVERLAADAPVAPGIATVDVALSGSEKAVLTLADGIERDLAGTRWRTWRIVAGSGGDIRFEGQAAVAWR